jgi:hypothetical protein
MTYIQYDDIMHFDKDYINPQLEFITMLYNLNKK